MFGDLAAFRRPYWRQEKRTIVVTTGLCLRSIGSFLDCWPVRFLLLEVTVALLEILPN